MAVFAAGNHGRFDRQSLTPQFADGTGDEIAVDAFFASDVAVVVVQIARSWRGQALLNPKMGGLSVSVGVIDYVTDPTDSSYVTDPDTGERLVSA